TGALDEVRIYRRALTASEVAALYGQMCETSSCIGLRMVCGVWGDGCGAGLSSGMCVEYDQCSAARCIDLPVCSITNAAWNVSSIRAGEFARASVAGSATCEGKEVVFMLFNDGGESEIGSTVFSDGSASVIWMSSSAGEYYFRAAL